MEFGKWQNSLLGVGNIIKASHKGGNAESKPVLVRKYYLIATEKEKQPLRFTISLRNKGSKRHAHDKELLSMIYCMEISLFLRQRRPENKTEDRMEQRTIPRFVLLDTLWGKFANWIEDNMMVQLRREKA